MVEEEEARELPLPLEDLRPKICKSRFCFDNAPVMRWGRCRVLRGNAVSSGFAEICVVFGTHHPFRVLLTWPLRTACQRECYAE